MIITTLSCLPIAYTDADGTNKKVWTRPGSHDYPMVDHKDPAVADQLRVYRKHSRIAFDELLASDLEILKEIPADDTKRAEKLLAAVSVKPSPVVKKTPGAPKAPKGKKKNGISAKPVKTAPQKGGKAGPEDNTSKSKG